MRNFLGLFYVFFSLWLDKSFSANVASCECGESIKEVSYANDSFIDEGRYPWIVKVKLPTIQTPLGPWIRDCSGVLISPYHILTSMICGFDVKSEQIEIWAGKYMIAESQSIWPWNKQKPTTKFKEHKFALIDRKLNIIELKHPLPLSDDVKPICLPDDHMDKIENIDKLVYTEWIEQQQGKKTIQLLKQFTIHGKSLKLYDDDEGYKTVKRPDISYDQGAPLMFLNKYNKWYLAGISTDESSFEPTPRQLILKPDPSKLEKARNFDESKLIAQVISCQKF